MKPAVSDILDGIEAEVLRAQGLHSPLNSDHEAYAVMQEEVDEFWQEVKKKREHRNRQHLEKEAIHIAAMAVRFIVDLGCAASKEKGDATQS